MDIKERDNKLNNEENHEAINDNSGFEKPLESEDNLVQEELSHPSFINIGGIQSALGNLVKASASIGSFASSSASLIKVMKEVYLNYARIINQIDYNAITRSFSIIQQSLSNYIMRR